MDEKFKALKTADDLSILNGFAFEEYLTQLFTDLGYYAEKTPASGDKGADIILEKGPTRIAVQAKQYTGPVGFEAVEEVFTAKSLYHADEAWVITPSSFTAQASNTAKRLEVKLLGASQINALIKQLLSPTTTANQSEKLTSRRKRTSYDTADTTSSDKTLGQYHGADPIVNIPSTTNTIGDYAFADVSVYPKLKDLFSKPYADSTRIKKITLTNSTKRLGKYAFSGCTSLNDCTLPTTSLVVDDSCFSCCGFEALTLLSNVKYGAYVYRGNKKLKRIKTDDKVSSIPKGCFKDCIGLESVGLGQKIKSIEPEAFSNCHNLKRINLAEGIESIGSKAFFNCTSLEIVDLPSTLKFLAIDAFSGCKNLRKYSITDLFDLAGVVITYSDGTPIPQEQLEMATNQELFFSKNYRNQSALNECWKYIDFVSSGSYQQAKNEELKALQRKKDELLTKVGGEIKTKKETLAQLKSECEAKIASLPLFAFTQKQETRRDYEIKIRLLEKATRELEDQLTIDASKLTSEINAREGDSTDFARKLDLTKSQVSLIIRDFSIPEKWIQQGRIKPEQAMIQDCKYFYETTVFNGENSQRLVIGDKDGEEVVLPNYASLSNRPIRYSQEFLIWEAAKLIVENRDASIPVFKSKLCIEDSSESWEILGALESLGVIRMSKDRKQREVLLSMDELEVLRNSYIAYREPWEIEHKALVFFNPAFVPESKSLSNSTEEADSEKIEIPSYLKE